MHIVSVDDGPTVETWSLVARDKDSFLVSGSTTGPQGVAQVGTAFTSQAGGLVLQVLPSRNGHFYRSGDRFTFEIGHYGYSDQPLKGTIGAGLSAVFPLDGDLLHMPKGSTRSFRVFNIALESTDILTADVELRYKGLSDSDLVIADKLRLVRQQ
jgi:hypothetical protein